MVWVPPQKCRPLRNLTFIVLFLLDFWASWFWHFNMLSSYWHVGALFRSSSFTCVLCKTWRLTFSQKQRWKSEGGGAAELSSCPTFLLAKWEWQPHQLSVPGSTAYFFPIYYIFISELPSIAHSYLWRVDSWGYLLICVVFNSLLKLR